MMDLRITANLSTLLGTAYANALAILQDWSDEIADNVGLTPITDVTDYVDGTADFKSFMTQVQNANGQGTWPLQQAYDVAVNLYNLVTFTALAPTTANFPMSTWMWINKVDNTSAPSAAQLAAFISSYDL